MCVVVAGVGTLWLARETQATAGLHNNSRGTLTCSVIHLFCTPTFTLTMAGLVSCNADLGVFNA